MLSFATTNEAEKVNIKIKYKSGYKYQLAEYFEIQTGIEGFSARTSFLSLYKTGRLGINEGYAWDGPSGPAIDTRNFMRGSLVHDALYQLMRRGRMDPETCRDQADRLLQRMFVEDSITIIRRSTRSGNGSYLSIFSRLREKVRIALAKTRAQWIYKSLKWFGARAADSEQEKPVLTAP